MNITPTTLDTNDDLNSIAGLPSSDPEKRARSIAGRLIESDEEMTAGTFERVAMAGDSFKEAVVKLAFDEHYLQHADALHGLAVNDSVARAMIDRDQRREAEARAALRKGLPNFAEKLRSCCHSE